jgi:uncharacterized membrane protein
VLATYYIVKFIIVFISNNLPDDMLVKFFPEFETINFYGIDYFDKFISFIVTFIFIIIIGYVFSNYLGKKILGFWEKILNKLPLINKIYAVFKQIIEQIILTVQNPKEEVFQRVVLLEYPRKGVYSIGFVSSKNKKFNNIHQDNLFNIFVPTTPNPTSGYLLIVPEKELIFIDMTVEQAMKYIISAGIVVDEIIK